MRRHRPVVVAVLLVAVIGLLAATGAPSQRRLVLPEGTLVAPTVRADTLRGRTVIVHYWASWCEPCRREAAEIAALPRRLDDQTVLVGVDWSDGRSRGLAFVQRHGWTFPNLEDPRGTTGRQNGLRGLPTTLIVSPDGVIRKQLVGPQTVDGLLAQLH